MKRLLIIFVAVLVSVTAYTQATTYKFDYKGAEFPPSCNPLKKSGAPFWDDWKLSHGSPSCGDVWGQNNFNLLKLVGRFSSGDFEEKSEGLYIKYNFKGSHTYDIEISLSHDLGDVVGYQLYAATGISEGSNTECKEEKAPTVNSKQLIIEEAEVHDGPTGNFRTTTKSNWRPDKDYDQLWLKSLQLYYGHSGSFFVDKITIVDLGQKDKTSPTVPGNLSASSTKNSIKITWTASTDIGPDASGIKHYEISRNNSSSYITTNSTSYTFSKLPSCSNFTFKVRAVDNATNVSSWSNTINVSTKSDLPSEVEFNTDLSNQQNPVLKAQDKIKILPGFKYVPQSSAHKLRTEIGGCNSLKSARIAEDNFTLEEGAQKDYEYGEIYKLPMLNFEAAIKMYPNPTTGLINIELENYKNKSISVSDFAGKVIYNSTVDRKSISIDLSDKPSGIYFMRIMDGSRSYMKKIIKN